MLIAELDRLKRDVHIVFQVVFEVIELDSSTRIVFVREYMCSFVSHSKDDEELQQ